MLVFLDLRQLEDLVGPYLRGVSGRSFFASGRVWSRNILRFDSDGLNVVCFDSLLCTY